MPPAPYEATFRDDGELCFLAEVPALSHIGRRFSELSDRSTHFVAPPEEQARWRGLTQRLEKLVGELKTVPATSWPAMEKQLKQEFAAEYPQACDRLPRGIREFFETSQMPLPEFVEWLLHAAETAWSENGGDEHGLDSTAYNARIDRLTMRLRTAGYQSEADRRMRQQDPARHAFMAQSMNLLLQNMNNPDPRSYQQMMVEQMQLFRDSPFFQKAQEAQLEFRSQLERIRESDPDLYRQQIEQLDHANRFMADPVAGLAEMHAAAAARAESQEEPADEDEPQGEPPVAEPGQWRFRCGSRKAVTPAQVRLFEELMERQEQLRPQIEAALREMHGWMGGPGAHNRPGDRVLFPENPDATDVPLNCFSVRQASLDKGQVVLTFDSLFGHFDEHGCGIIIRNGKVDRYGTWDDMYGDEDPGAYEE
jgi:hypothetical protein